MLSTLISLRQRWESVEMARLRAMVCAAYIAKQGVREFRPQEERVATFFDDIGVYLKHGTFSAVVVWDQYSYYVEHYWLVMAPLIKDFRESTKDDTWFESFEAVYEASLKVGRRRRQ
jgi:hypothetical protein